MEDLIELLAPTSTLTCTDGCRAVLFLGLGGGGRREGARDEDALCLAADGVKCVFQAKLVKRGERVGGEGYCCSSCFPLLW